MFVSVWCCNLSWSEPRICQDFRRCSNAKTQAYSELWCVTVSWNWSKVVKLQTHCTRTSIAICFGISRLPLPETWSRRGLQYLKGVLQNTFDSAPVVRTLNTTNTSRRTYKCMYSLRQHNLQNFTHLGVTDFSLCNTWIFRIHLIPQQSKILKTLNTTKLATNVVPLTCRVYSFHCCSLNVWIIWGLRFRVCQGFRETSHTLAYLILQFDTTHF